ncbi:MAG: beta-lactamase family protein [Saprospiraceae bacterium]|nr:beta-lactamase family protein [Saprospiraceae bacterium]
MKKSAIRFFALLLPILFIAPSCEPEDDGPILQTNFYFDIDLFAENVKSALDGNAVGWAFSISQKGAFYTSDAGGFAVTVDDAPTSGMAVEHSPTKIQDIASVSKTITALCVLRLLQEKGMDVDQKLWNWMPGMPWQHGSGDIPQGEIRAFLTHTSGIPATNLDYFSLKSRYFENDTYPDKSYNYTNANYAYMRLVIAYLYNSLGELDYPLASVENDVANNGDPESDLEDAINAAYIEAVNKYVFAPCGISWKEPKPDGETNPTMNYNFNTATPGWNKGDMTKFAGSAGWRLSAKDLNNILATLKYTDKILNEEFKTKMNDELLGWQNDPGIFEGLTGGGVSYGHEGYYEDKYSPNAAAVPQGRGVFTGMTIFPNGVEVAAVVNSLGGTNTMCRVLRTAYDNAWVQL